jgi:ribonuclease-3
MAAAAGHLSTDAGLGELAETLGHSFANIALLADAVTHPSLLGLEHGAGRGGGAGTPAGAAQPGAAPAVVPAVAPGVAYERLEFLGDRVLGLVVAQWLLERHPGEREGALAKRHAALVRREALGRVADAIGLGRYLRLSPGEVSGGGRQNRTILADACEAVIGALYLDGGLTAAAGFVRRGWAAMIDREGGQAPPVDAKTALQEWAQGRGKPLPVYEMTEQTGLAHEPVFRVMVRVDGEEPVTGCGPTKRAAEKRAATLLLSRLGVVIDD